MRRDEFGGGVPAPVPPSSSSWSWRWGGRRAWPSRRVDKSDACQVDSQSSPDDRLGYAKSLLVRCDTESVEQSCAGYSEVLLDQTIVAAAVIFLMTRSLEAGN